MIFLDIILAQSRNKVTENMPKISPKCFWKTTCASQITVVLQVNKWLGIKGYTVPYDLCIPSVSLYTCEITGSTDVLAGCDDLCKTLRSN